MTPRVLTYSTPRGAVTYTGPQYQSAYSGIPGIHQYTSAQGVGWPVGASPMPSSGPVGQEKEGGGGPSSSLPNPASFTYPGYTPSNYTPAGYTQDGYVANPSIPQPVPPPPPPDHGAPTPVSQTVSAPPAQGVHVPVTQEAHVPSTQGGGTPQHNMESSQPLTTSQPAIPQGVITPSTQQHVNVMGQGFVQTSPSMYMGMNSMATPTMFVDQMGNPVQQVRQVVQYIDQYGNPIAAHPFMQSPGVMQPPMMGIQHPSGQSLDEDGPAAKRARLLQNSPDVILYKVFRNNNNTYSVRQAQWNHPMFYEGAVPLCNLALEPGIQDLKFLEVEQCLLDDQAGDILKESLSNVPKVPDRGADVMDDPDAIKELDREAISERYKSNYVPMSGFRGAGQRPKNTKVKLAPSPGTRLEWLFMRGLQDSCSQFGTQSASLAVEFFTGHENAFMFRAPDPPQAEMYKMNKYDKEYDKFLANTQTAIGAGAHALLDALKYSMRLRDKLFTMALDEECTDIEEMKREVGAAGQILEEVIFKRVGNATRILGVQFDSISQERRNMIAKKSPKHKEMAKAKLEGGGFKRNPNLVPPSEKMLFGEISAATFNEKFKDVNFGKNATPNAKNNRSNNRGSAYNPRQLNQGRNQGNSNSGSGSGNFRSDGKKNNSQPRSNDKPNANQGGNSGSDSRNPRAPRGRGGGRNNPRK